MFKFVKKIIPTKVKAKIKVFLKMTSLFKYINLSS